MADERNRTFVMSDGWYTFLKRLVQLIIPAFGTFYVTMAGLWDLPNADKVAGTCLALSLFLGVCLGISTAQYNASGAGFDGKVLVQKGPGAGAPLMVTGVHYDGDTKQLQEKSSIKLKVEEVLPLPGDLEVDDEDEDESDVPPMNPATDTRRRSKANKAPKKEE